jgi:hypothetical protein
MEKFGSGISDPQHGFIEYKGKVNGVRISAGCMFSYYSWPPVVVLCCVVALLSILPATT